MKTDINFWLENASSLNHQLFMLVMGALYVMASILGVSYKAMNIYVYFVLYPISFSLFLKHKVKYLIVLSSLIFFTVPHFENFSSRLFDECVIFLNFTAEKYNSDYIKMSIYLCVYLPLIIYFPFLYLKMSKSSFCKMIIYSGSLILFYILLLAPYFKELLLFVATSYRV